MVLCQHQYRYTMQKSKINNRAKKFLYQLPGQNGSYFAMTFSRKKTFEFCLKFQWNLFLGVPLTISLGHKNSIMVCQRQKRAQQIDGLVLEKRNSIANALEFRLSYLLPRRNGSYFSMTFSWKKTFEFCLKFQWNLLLGVHLTISLGHKKSIMVCQRQKRAQQIDGLVLEKRNSTANALEFCLSCTKPLKSPKVNETVQQLKHWHK